MHIEKLSLINFKNCTQTELVFNDKINCITGNNGVGKTNLLDAIYYLSFCKSFFNPNDSQNIKYGESFFVIQGKFKKNGQQEDIYCGFKKGQKKTIKRNGKSYSRLSDHIGQFPTIMLSPFDSNLIHLGSEERRKLLDVVISIYDNEYLQTLIRFNKALTQRNALLKDFAHRNYFDKSMLTLWNEQLAIYGKKIFESRSFFVSELLPVFKNNYEFISEGKEDVNIKYESQLLKASLLELLELNTDKDRALQYTSAGIHRDDLTFTLNGHPIKKTGSQGQQKTFVMALRFAQYDFIQKHTGTSPIMLLDDIFDKLDGNRVQQIIKLVADNHFGQIFITDTNPDRVKSKLSPLSINFKLLNIT